MSTEHQQYSIANQADALKRYANSHGIEITRSFVDRGKSGLDLAGRPGLKALLRTAVSGSRNFSTLLVYDVSRWGRFQDVDESAFYEYALKKAGVKVIYCVEPFLDNGSPTDALLKTLKRAMAAEYSRELSVKVFEGQARIARLGYRLGGNAGLGFRRMLVSADGSQRTLLEAGQHKTIQTDRVTLVRGPLAEVRVVQKVFDLFIKAGLSEARIAAYLNERGITTRLGNPWIKKTIRGMLTNPKYVGDLVFGRTSAKMQTVPVPTPRDQWIYVPDKFESIVSRETWEQAQDVYRRRVEDVNEEVMLARLKALLLKHGRLSCKLIDAEPGMQRAETYQHRFGSLLEAYRRVGWEGERRYRYIGRRPFVRDFQRQLNAAITNRLAETADAYSKDEKWPLWRVNQEISIYASVASPTTEQKKRRVWIHTGFGTPASDLIVVARLNPEGDAFMDYFIFAGGHRTPIRIYDENPRSMEVHRFCDLSFIDGLSRRKLLVEE